MKKSLIILLGTVLSISACDELDMRQPGLLVPKTADQDASVPSIGINNTILHAQTYGNAADPMLVILHSGPGGDYRSLLNCKQFADEGFFVVFYDQRGSGLSRRESKSRYDLTVMQDDLAGVIHFYRSSPQQKVFLLGQSWGAILATAYINANPNDIQGAILCEPGGFVWQDIMDYVKRSRDYGIGSETLNDATYVDQFITGKESEDEILDYKLGITNPSGDSPDSPLGNEGKVPFWRFGANVNLQLFELGNNAKPDWRTNLESFEPKILFAYSERNRAYGLSHAQHVSSAYPSVELVRIDGTGHNMMTFPTGWSNFFPIALNYLNELK